MIYVGCLAIAKSTKVTINDPEVADVNWFTHHQIKLLIEKFSNKSTLSSLRSEMKSWEESTPRSKSGSVISSSQSSSNSNDDDVIDDSEIDNIRIPGEYAIAHHLLKKFANREYDMYLPKQYRSQKSSRSSNVSINTSTEKTNYSDNNNIPTRNTIRVGVTTQDISNNNTKTTSNTSATNTTSTTTNNTNNDISKTSLSSSSSSSSPPPTNITNINDTSLIFWKRATIISLCVSLMSIGASVYILNRDKLKDIPLIKSLKDIPITPLFKAIKDLKFDCAT